MAKKKKKSAAPSGLTISRDGLKFTIEWKIPSKGYGAGQWLWYRLRTKKNGSAKWTWGKWKKISVGHKATKKTVSLDKTKYYPATSKRLSGIEFKVKGKSSDDKKYTYTATSSTHMREISKPNNPSVSYALDSTGANKGTFSWETDCSSNDKKHFSKTQVQTAIMKNYKGEISKATFRDASYTAASGSWTIAEDGSPTQSNTYCRIVRVKAKGVAGDSEWKYAYHYYSIPERPVIQKT